MAPAKRPHRRTPFIFTREVFDMIPVWVEMGARPEEIAAAIGSTVGSLKVKCCKAGISLAAVHPSIKNGVQTQYWGVIRREALRRGISVPRLTAEVLMGVAEHDLFAAVLGDYDVDVGAVVGEVRGVG